MKKKEKRNKRGPKIMIKSSITIKRNKSMKTLCLDKMHKQKKK